MRDPEYEIRDAMEWRLPVIPVWKKYKPSEDPKAEDGHHPGLGLRAGTAAGAGRRS